MNVNIEEYVSQLETLVNIDSGSKNPEGLRKVAMCLKQWYEEAGWYVKVHELGPQTGPLLEVSNHPDCDHYDAMFLGHMDTVFPDGTAAERPFKREGNIITGPGSDDMKNGDLAMLHIAKNMSPETSAKINVCMCHNPDEEISSKFSKGVFREIGARSDRIFIMESAQNNGAAHVFSRKGMVNYFLKFHGIAGHAGYMFEIENASAIEEMAHYVVELAKLKDREKQTSLNVGIVRGGTAGNTIPGEAYMEIEARFLTREERDRIVNRIEEMIHGKPFVDKVTVEVVLFDETTPWEQNEKGLAYIEHVGKIAESLGIPFEERKRGGLSDGNHLWDVCPVIMDGMGPYGEGAHSDHEFTTVDSLEPCVRLFEALLDDAAAGK